MKIIRFYQNGRPRTIRRGLTLEECERHCSDPETSSSTAKGAAARRRTQRMGPWFDGFDYESDGERRAEG